jgi:non-specific serine/threonine protein kinase
MTTRARRADAALLAPVASAAGLAISPHGTLRLDASAPDRAPLSAKLVEAFAESPARGLLHLASAALGAPLPPSLAFAREIAKLFFAHLCAAPDLEGSRAKLAVPAPRSELEVLVSAVPPMLGAEYLSADVLREAWSALAGEVQRELDAFDGSVEAYLHGKSPLWNAVGRVHFHLAENKGDDRAPFAFLATYATKLSKQGRVQHAPLGRAVEEHAGAANRAMLLALLQPVQRAAEKSPLLRQMVADGELFHPLAWTPRDAYAFLQDIPVFEAAGVMVRLPDWWHARRPPRPQVKVTVGAKKPGGVGMDAMLDFEVALTLGDEALSAAEWRRVLATQDHLVLLKGKWVEVDREKLAAVLAHFEKVQRAAAQGVSFHEGMRLLAGASSALADPEAAAEATAWAKIEAGPWLAEVLADLRDPHGSRDADPGDELRGTLRPYQRDGVHWLWLLSRLGLGACLADDMGLGKTIQVIALLLLLRRHGERGPHLLVVPASLLGNWQAELDRFAPSLSTFFFHPSLLDAEAAAAAPARCDEAFVVVTTYGTLLRTAWLRERRWGLVALDEAQAIKNPDAKQTRAVKSLSARARLALTGTPVENRLGDLWSLFDFLCPGLLGSAKAFREAARKLEASGPGGFAPLRALTRPYILRRLKSDRRVLADLPDKTEVRAFCALTPAQAALYQRAVGELAEMLRDAEGMKRRGAVLAYLLRFKQICNHPSQWLGDGAYDPAASGKLARLRELCEPIAARQEKVLVFTQFREMTGPLAAFLAAVFGRAGLVLSGETAVKKRAQLVADFQAEGGPPFFVLSLKAGGTGLNLTAAPHVIHFDRWWNPAVENQATDRAYRIGQRKNVLVHKFVCRGTIEEKIDAMIEQKRGLSEEILSGGGEAWLTELPSEEILRLCSLDLSAAVEELS